MVIFYIFFLTLLGCSTSARRVKRLVGGEPLRSGQFPFFAQLILPDESFKAYLCSASLIHPKWILTSADCFANTPEGIVGIERLGFNGIYTVYMGSLQTNDSSIYPNSIAKLHIHPLFYKEKLKDGWKITCNIALAELRWQYNLTNSVNTVYLPWSSNPIKRCDIGKVISMGPTSWYDQTKKNSVNVVLIRVRDALKEIRHPSPTMFYSQAILESRHVLEDDVGAPFVCYPDPEFEDEVIQFGVVAGTMNTTDGSMITFIEDVVKYMDFIEKHVPAVKYYTKKPLPTYSRRLEARIQDAMAKGNTFAARDGNRLMHAKFFAVLYWFIVVYLEA